LAIFSNRVVYLVFYLQVERGDRDRLFERFYRGNPTHKRLRELG
jgi:hypothetical protein